MNDPTAKQPAHGEGLSRRRAMGLAAMGVAGAWLPQAGWASTDYPNKAIRVIVPFPAGGGTDVAARLYTGPMAEALGQPVVVDNRGGATGAIGTVAVIQSPPDGYTLLVGSDSSVLLGPLTAATKTFDPIKDLIPIAIFANNPLVMVAHPSVKGNTVEEIVAESRQRQLTFASIGEGSLFHFAGELFNHLTGARLVHVPYKGAAPAMADVRAGHVHFMFSTVGQALPFLGAGGGLKAIAVTSKERSSHLPDVKTLQEAGLKQYHIESWNGLFAPTGTPQPVVDKLAQTIRQIAQNPQFKASVEKTAATIPLLSPAELKDLIAHQQKTYGEQYQQIAAMTKPKS